MLCSRLGPLETRSAIRRKLLHGQITAAYAMQALRQFQQEMERWTVLPITEDVFTQAASVIDAYGLRTLDALQLSTALLANVNLGPVTLVLYDTRLSDAAQASGLATIKP